MKAHSVLSITLHQQEGLSLPQFAELTGLSVVTLRKYCNQGRIVGAHKNPLTKKWWIYPPAKLVTGRNWS